MNTDNDIMRIFVFRPYIPVYLKKSDMISYKLLKHAISKQCGMEIKSVHEMSGTEIQTSEDVACDNVYIAVEKKYNTNNTENLKSESKIKIPEISKKLSSAIHISVRDLYSLNPDFVAYGCTLQARDLKSMSCLLFAVSNIVKPPGGCIYGLYDENRFKVTDPVQIENGKSYFAMPHIITTVGYNFIHNHPPRNDVKWFEGELMCSVCGHRKCLVGSHSKIKSETVFENKPNLTNSRDFLINSITDSANLDENRELESHHYTDIVHRTFPIKSIELNDITEQETGNLLTDTRAFFSAHCSRQNSNVSIENESLATCKEDSLQSLLLFQNLNVINYEIESPFETSKKHPRDYNKAYNEELKRIPESQCTKKVPCKILIKLNSGNQPLIPCQLSSNDLESIENVCVAIAQKFMTPQDKSVHLLDSDNRPVLKVEQIKHGHAYKLKLNEDECESIGFETLSENNRLIIERKDCNASNGILSSEESAGDRIKQCPLKFLVCKNKNGPCKEVVMNTKGSKNINDLLKILTEKMDSENDPFVRLSTRDGQLISHPDEILEGCLYSVTTKSKSTRGHKFEDNEAIKSDQISVYSTSSLMESISEEQRILSKSNSENFPINSGEISREEIAKAVEEAVVKVLSNVGRNRISNSNTRTVKSAEDDNDYQYNLEQNIVVLQHTRTSTSITMLSKNSEEDLPSAEIEKEVLKTPDSRTADIYKKDKTELKNQSFASLIDSLLLNDGSNDLEKISTPQKTNEEKLVMLRLCIKGLTILFDTLDKELRNGEDDTTNL